MNPGSAQVLVETPSGCVVNVARSVDMTVFPVYEADEMPSSVVLIGVRGLCDGGSHTSIGSSPPPGAVLFSDGASSVSPLRRRRSRCGSGALPSAVEKDMIGRFQTIINIVKSAGTSSTDRSENGELLKAVQRLKLSEGDPRFSQRKRQRRSVGSPESPESAPAGGYSVGLLQETIAAIEQMRLSEPMERSEVYAESLSKLKDLLRGEEV